MVKRRATRRIHFLSIPLKIFATVVVIALAIGPFAPTKIQASDHDATLRLYGWQAPTILNPHLSIGDKDLTVSRISYEPLASFNNQGQLVPILAAEIPTRENGGVAADGMSVRWRLKQEIKWSDGEPFTADDVRFTYEYITDKDTPSTSRPTYTAVKNLEVIDDHTIKVHFTNTNPAWALPFVGSQGMILPRHIFKDYVGAKALTAPANQMPVGTGAFRAIEFKTEDILLIGEDSVKVVKIVYERNPYFRDPEKPHFSRIEMTGGGGDSKRAARAMQNGQFDVGWNLTVDDSTLNKVESQGKSKVLITPSAFVERIMLNFTDPNRATNDGEYSSVKYPHPFLTDNKVRQALAYAVDRDAIAKLYGRGGMASNNILVSPEHYKAHNTTYNFELAKAAALLDEAGWKDTNGDGIRDKAGVKMRISFMTSINPVRQLTQQLVQKAFESLGIEVELKKVDSSIFLGPPEQSTNTRRQFYADLEEFSFSNKSPDPAAYMSGWLCDQAAQKADSWSKPNWSRYCNLAFDALYKQSTTEMDPEKRTQLFVAMNKLLYDDVAVIPLVQTLQPTGLSADLKGFDPTPWDADTWNIADWTR
jgi:peptide/nickel transport system substrate-binding protein